MCCLAQKGTGDNEIADIKLRARLSNTPRDVYSCRFVLSVSSSPSPSISTLFSDIRYIAISLLLNRYL